jgi:hypothetical protein
LPGNVLTKDVLQNHVVGLIDPGQSWHPRMP